MDLKKQSSTWLKALPVFYGFITCLVFYGCKQKNNTLFSSLPASETGIDFENRIIDTDTLNILDYLYYYNGGGVAVGDFNNDGLADIYFTSNQQSNRLYLNKGGFKFEDITGKAAIQGKGNWKTGVTLADINADGFLDIYVCEVGGYKNFRGRNELFINNGLSAPGEITFTEQASAYGLAVEGFNTQASFFDFDHDGDLDMFLVNHSVHSNSSYGDSSMRRVKDAASGDKLFRNDSTATGRKFVEITESAGIYSSTIGYGLNVAVADINNDGWEDIYVSNDFHENDYYYLNNQNGTFTEINRDAFGHESRFSMGSAIADMNNDGWNDIITLDMLPADEKILKTSAGDDPYDIYNFKYSFGYYHQNARNCLQLNNGDGKRFSDIALYSGISATDWSWSPLAEDFDNDGIRDLFVSNGIIRRPNDLDFIKYYSNKIEKDSSRISDFETIRKMPEGKMHNYIFRGSDSLKFSDQSIAWGFDEPGFSNGAAAADLDNDGDLDIVVNNMNSPAGIYRNNSPHTNGNHFLDIQLEGEGQNKWGIGAKIALFSGYSKQYNYLAATRGFESASLHTIHFGTGRDSVIDTLQVIWPDGASQILTRVKTDQRINLSYKNSERDQTLLIPTVNQPSNQLLTDITSSIGFDYKHNENDFTDFNEQPLIPHMVSTQGPKLAVADINGDGLEDFYVCGALMQAGVLFRQTTDGKFIPTNQNLFAADSVCEDVNALFFDADGDGDMDLYVVSGGNETENEIENLDRLYLNDGKGNYTKSKGLPELHGNKSVAIAADIDKDGDIDLFVGGRVVAGKYGKIPTSYLLLNNGKGTFEISTPAIAPGLSSIGMVTDAAFTDMDKDGWKDLVMAGEWMPITIYKNNKGKFNNVTPGYGLENTTGLWTTLHIADLDRDGFDDILAGNLGVNSKLHASEKYPLKLYTGDLDNNGVMDPLLAEEVNGKYFSFFGKEELDKQIPSVLRKQFLSYSTFAGKTLDEVFGNKLDKMKVLKASMLSSVQLMNNGHGKFIIEPLPAQLQWSPVFSFFTGDINGDGYTDILEAGNFYGVSPYEGRYDASYGGLLLGNDKNNFIPVDAWKYGFKADGEVRDLKVIKSINGKKLLAVARNNGRISLFSMDSW